MNIETILKTMGVDYELYGSPEFDSLGLIESDTDLKICSFVENKKYLNRINDSVSLLLTNFETGEEINNKSYCIVDNPRLVFFMMHNHLCNDDLYIRKKTKTRIGKDCSISKLSFIADNNVRIGDNVVIEEFVSIKENVTIGDDCIIRAGTIIGGEGFEQKRYEDKVLSVCHAGGVIIGNNVELQQDNCVDKAIYPWDNTIIGDYCRTDNKVHIAHADKLHKRVLIAACTCIAGRVEIEEDVWIGPGVTLINGIHIGKNARVNIGSVATQNVPEGESVTGNFAIDHNKFLDNLKKIR